MNFSSSGVSETFMGNLLPFMANHYGEL